MIRFFFVMSFYRNKERAIENIAKHLTILNWREDYKPGNKEFCRSIPEESEYFKQVISAFYKTEGRKWSDCFTQSEELHYCWIAIDLKLDRDRPLQLYAYTGKSGAIWGRLCHSTHGNLELDRSDKILIHTTKSSDESNAALVEADEFNELDGKATVPQVEQSNINAIRAIRSIKLLNRKDEDANRIINPVLFKKMKQIELMAEQLNKKLLKLRQVWLDGSLVPKVSEDQLRQAFNDAATEWFDAHKIDPEQTFFIDMPELKNKIKLTPADASVVEKTKHIIREIKGCKIFNNDELGLKHCFKYVFKRAFCRCVDIESHRNFIWKILDLEDEITLEQAGKRYEKYLVRQAVEERDKGLSEAMVVIRKKRELIERLKKLKKQFNQKAQTFEKARVMTAHHRHQENIGLTGLENDLIKLTVKIVDLLVAKDPNLSKQAKSRLHCRSSWHQSNSPQSMANYNYRKNLFNTFANESKLTKWNNTDKLTGTKMGAFFTNAELEQMKENSF